MISFSAAVLIVLPDVPWMGSASPRAALTACRGNPCPMTISAPAGPRSAPTKTRLTGPRHGCGHETAQTQYRGLRDLQVAFGRASILDELSRHLRDLDDRLRRRVVELCRELLRAN